MNNKTSTSNDLNINNLGFNKELLNKEQLNIIDSCIEVYNSNLNNGTFRFIGNNLTNKRMFNKQQVCKFDDGTYGIKGVSIGINNYNNKENIYIKVIPNTTNFRDYLNMKLYGYTSIKPGLVTNLSTAKDSCSKGSVEVSISPNNYGVENLGSNNGFTKADTYMLLFELVHFYELLYNTLKEIIIVSTSDDDDEEEEYNLIDINKYKDLFVIENDSGTNKFFNTEYEHSHIAELIHTSQFYYKLLLKLSNMFYLYVKGQEDDESKILGTYPSVQRFDQKYSQVLTKSMNGKSSKRVSKQLSIMNNYKESICKHLKRMLCFLLINELRNNSDHDTNGFIFDLNTKEIQYSEIPTYDEVVYVGIKASGKSLMKLPNDLYPNSISYYNARLVDVYNDNIRDSKHRKITIPKNYWDLYELFRKPNKTLESKLNLDTRDYRIFGRCIFEVGSIVIRVNSINMSTFGLTAKELYGACKVTYSSNLINYDEVDCDDDLFGTFNNIVEDIASTTNDNDDEDELSTSFDVDDISVDE